MGRAEKHAWLVRVGEIVAARRKELGFVSQLELAAAAQVADNTEAQLERGQSWPQKANRRKLEAALQWPEGTLDELRRGEAAPKPSLAPVVEEAPAVTSPSMLGVARELVAAVRVVMAIVSEHPDPRSTLVAAHLERSVRGMETMLAAALPDAGEAFSDTMAALEELHSIRLAEVAMLANHG